MTEFICEFWALKIERLKIVLRSIEAFDFRAPALWGERMSGKGASERKPVKGCRLEDRERIPENRRVNIDERMSLSQCEVAKASRRRRMDCKISKFTWHHRNVSQSGKVPL